MKKRIYSIISDVWNKIAKIHADPQKVALGYAFGIFLAASPLIGIKVLIAIPVTLLLKWNKTAVLIGILHINPITGPIFYGFSFMIGKIILGGNVDISLASSLTSNSPAEMLTTQLTLFKCLLLGGVVIGLPVSLFAYYAVKKLLIHNSKLNSKAL